MAVLIAFLAGFYLGVFTLSLVAMARHGRDKKEIRLVKKPRIRQQALS